MDWKITDNKLEKSFKFKDFAEALEFVNKVGKLAEQVQHHPDIQITNYNQVLISTTTHDAGNRVTDRDNELTKLIDTIN